MASEKPPPYFPQGSLAPPDPNRYRKFKMIVALIVIAFVLIIIGAGFTVFYFARALF